MTALLRGLTFVLVLFASGLASAQDNRGWLGVDVVDLTQAEADKLGWDAPRGAKVNRAPVQGSPADKAGLKLGDIVVAVDRVMVDTASEFNAAVESKRAGTQLQLQVVAGGRERRVAATVGDRPKTGATRVATDLPQLQLDPGGHMALIRGLEFTPDGKYMITAGDDKVIRVWDWKAGTTVRMMRGYSEPGSEGKIFAIALSPDAKTLAVSGWMRIPGQSGHVVRLYEFETGRLLALLHGHTNIINGLAFSRDGKMLISGGGLADHSAIVWDVEKRTKIWHLKGHTDTIFAVGFLPDGQTAVTGSDDHTLKLWSLRDGKEITTMRGHGDKVISISISQKDWTIASGGDTGEIHLWDGRTGAHKKLLVNQGGYVGVLRFLKDGTQLLSTCGYTGCNKTQRIWDVASGKQVLAYAENGDTVLGAQPTPDGRLVATAGGQNQAVHIWEMSTGKRTAVLAGNGAPGWSTAFSADSKRFAWGSHWQNGTYHAHGPLEMMFRIPGAKQLLGQPEKLDGPVNDYKRAMVNWGPYTLSHRKGGNYGYDAILDLHKDGKLVTSIERDSTTGYGHWCYSFANNGTMIVTGGANGALQSYDLTGKKLHDFIGHDAVLWALAPSPDGRYLLSGSADQTVRLWNLQTGELIITLFVSTDDTWVMWTPQGYYVSSPGADKIVGWQINRGPETSADYAGADQLRTHLNRPDIVEKAIILASAEQAVRESPGTTFKLADLLAKPLPMFRIASPTSGATVTGGRALVQINLDPMPANLPIKAMKVQVNGRLVEEVTPEVGTGGFKGERTFDVPLSRGANKVVITLNNEVGDRAEAITINHDGEGALDKRGTLYVLAVGVDRYQNLGNTCGLKSNQSWDMRFSGADAQKLVEAVEARLGPAHTKVVKRVLTNGGAAADAPTATNIIDAIDMLREAKETDTVLVFIAGHGYNEGPSYRFLATNAERSGDTFKGVTVVPWQILQEAVERAKGRRILFLDTCHSGNAYNQTLGNAAYHANIVAYTSARFDQEALEDAKLGHGLFTYALVEGLEGKGVQGAKRELSTKELASYLVKRVDELAKSMRGEQEPQFFKGRDAEDYVLSRW